MAWLRAFRLVFGTTTAATAPTLPICLGGLGIGGLVLGRRADRVTNPVRLYAWLELGVSLGALASVGRIGSPLAAQARGDLDAFRAGAPAIVETGPGTRSSSSF